MSYSTAGTLFPNFRCLQLNNSTSVERPAGIIGRLVASAVLVAAIAAGACNWRDVSSQDRIHGTSAGSLKQL